MGELTPETLEEVGRKISEPGRAILGEEEGKWVTEPEEPEPDLERAAEAGYEDSPYV
jgi:hypothetical protein